MRRALHRLIAVTILGLAAQAAAGQVVADGRAGDVPRRHLVSVRVPTGPVLSALRRGGAPAASRIAAGKRDSLVLTLEKPMPRSWRRPKRRAVYDSGLPGARYDTGRLRGLAPRPPAPRRAGVTGTWVDALFEGPGFVDVAFENGGFLIPPDPTLAVGPGHVAVVVNTSLAVFEEDGTPVWRQGMRAFFAGLDPQGTLFDPRVRYDPFADRFLAVILELDPGEVPRSSLLVGVSDGPDAAGTWSTVRIDTRVDVDSVAHWADYPGLAVDGEALYVTANLFAFEGGAYGGTRLWIVDKAALYAGSDSSVTVLDPFALVGLPELSATIQPAAVLPPGPPDSTGTWLMEFSGLTDGEVSYVAGYRVSDPLGTPSVEAAFFEAGPVDDLTIPLPEAPQAGSPFPVETNDRRMLDAVLGGGRLLGTTTVAPPAGPDAGQATALWVDVDVADPADPQLVHAGLVGGEELGPGTSTFFPALSLGADGSVLLGFSVSSAGTYAGAAAAGRLPDDPAGWLSPPALVRPGDGPYVRTFGGGLNRWGDYSGVAADPAADGTFWVFNQYAMAPGSELLGEDGQWGTVLARVAVDRRNTPPSARNARVEVDEDAAVTFVLEADDADGDVPVYALADGPHFGTALLDSARVTYVPAPDYFGPDSLRFVVTDDLARSDTGLVRIAVRPVNDPPVAVADSLETVEDVPLTASLAANDRDVDGDPLIYAVVGPLPVGELVLDPDGTARYAPPTEFGGETGFRYRVTDPDGAWDEADVHITVVPINDPPRAFPVVVVAYRDQPILLPLNGDDPDGPRPAFEISTPPAVGEVFEGSQGHYYRAPAGFAGRDSLFYRAYDGLDYSPPAIARVFVITNRLPEAVADAYAVNEGDSIRVAGPGVLANDRDTDGDPIEASLLEAPARGTVTLAPDGGFVYRHDGSETTADRFVYRVTDPGGLADEAEVRITVRPVNDAPTALPDSVVVPAGVATVIPLRATDAEGDSLVYAIAVPAGRGTVAIQGRSAVYEPDPGFAGPDAFRFTVTDGEEASTPAEIRLRVEGEARIQVLHAAVRTLAEARIQAGDSVLVASLPAAAATGFLPVPAGVQALSVRPAAPDSAARDVLERTLADGAAYLLVIADCCPGAPATRLFVVGPVEEAAAPGTVGLEAVGAWPAGAATVTWIADTPDHAPLAVWAERLSAGGTVSLPDLVPTAYNVEVAGGGRAPVLRFDLAPLSGERAFLVVHPSEGDPDVPDLRVLRASGAQLQGAVVTRADVDAPAVPFRVTDVFPNPAREAATVVVDLPEDGTVRLELVDVLGRTVRTVVAPALAAGAGRRVRVDLAGLAAGVYGYRVSFSRATAPGQATGVLLVVR